MASLSYYYGTFMFILLASTITSCALAASPAACATATNEQSLETLKNLAKSAMAKISNSTVDFAPNGTLEKLIINTSPNDKVAMLGLGSCRELFSLAMYNLNDSLSSFETMTDETVEVSLATGCAALSYLESCIDVFNTSASQIQNSVSTRLNDPIVEITRGSKAVSEMERCQRAAASSSSSSPRKSDHFLEQYYSTTSSSDGRDDLSWLSAEDSELIQSKDIKPDIVVALDGSGNFKTISEAVKAAPRQREQRFFIHVKKGIYFENVKIDADQWNVVMFGDGKDNTIVAADLSNAGGFNIFSSATFAVHGKRFIARDIGFLNKAGPDKGQAVALLSDSDRSVFYKCRIDGYQDTLHASAGRQFYSECDIYGTIDFIFGAAAIVVQNSNILFKRPLTGQGNAITASGRTDPSCRTGIVIQSSTIKTSEDIRGAPTSLGRPWKAYAVAVFINNSMESLISPVGWFPMSGIEPANTIFLAEYMNRGPGSNVNGRVGWVGVKRNISTAEANQYTVSSLLRGEKWISSSNVTFNPGL